MLAFMLAWVLRCVRVVLEADILIYSIWNAAQVLAVMVFNACRKNRLRFVSTPTKLFERRAGGEKRGENVGIDCM